MSDKFYVIAEKEGRLSYVLPSLDLSPTPVDLKWPSMNNGLALSDLEAKLAENNLTKKGYKIFIKTYDVLSELQL